LNNTEIRNVLAAFLFTGEDVFQPIQTLSGGEQGRVSLAKLMLSESNLLLLDEPTNHLDAQSREILEDALREATREPSCTSATTGTSSTAPRHGFWSLDGGNFVNYIGNYDYYLEKKAERLAKEEEKLPKEAVYSEAKLDWQTQKALEAEKRKHENALRATEEEISRLEEEIRAIDAEFELPETGLDVARCQELAKKRKEAETALSGLYEKWEELAEG
jgi:ATP-binding cassette subfamily F protein 3